MIRALALAPLLLAGCVGADAVVLQTQREVARSVVNATVAAQFPGVNAAPYTDCIIDNATGAEIGQFATQAATGGSEAAAQLVLQIAARPATSQCLLLAGLSSRA